MWIGATYLKVFNVDPTFGRGLADHNEHKCVSRVLTAVVSCGRVPSDSQKCILRLSVTVTSRRTGSTYVFGCQLGNGWWWPCQSDNQGTRRREFNPHSSTSLPHILFVLICIYDPSHSLFLLSSLMWVSNWFLFLAVLIPIFSVPNHQILERSARGWSIRFTILMVQHTILNWIHLYDLTKPGFVRCNIRWKQPWEPISAAQRGAELLWPAWAWKNSHRWHVGAGYAVQIHVTWFYFQRRFWSTHFALPNLLLCEYKSAFSSPFIWRNVEIHRNS